MSYHPNLPIRVTQQRFKTNQPSIQKHDIITFPRIQLIVRTGLRTYFFLCIENSNRSIYVKKMNIHTPLLQNEENEQPESVEVQEKKKRMRRNQCKTLIPEEHYECVQVIVKPCWVGYLKSSGPITPVGPSFQQITQAYRVSKRKFYN